MGSDKNEIAVVMAAGLGSRMRPLTERIAKPLVKVHGMPMIETVITALNCRGVSAIYVVVGYKKEQFSYLKDKYSNVSLIDNTEYERKNNISSIYCACDKMRGHNCFVCEADLVIKDKSLLKSFSGGSSYFGKMVKGHSDDWVFEQDSNGRITHVGKGGTDVYNMVGISYFKQKDTDILVEAIFDTYSQSGHEALFWDEVVDHNLDRMELAIYPIGEGQITEIDTIDELAVIDPAYRNENGGADE